MGRMVVGDQPQNVIEFSGTLFPLWRSGNRKRSRRSSAAQPIHQLPMLWRTVPDKMIR